MLISKILKKTLFNKNHYPEKDGYLLVQIKSSKDNQLQKAYFYASKAQKCYMPLIVQLHEWSCDYSVFAQRHELGNLCKNADWNYIFPDFRGANNTPESCMSNKAICDIDDAIDFAIENGNVDIDKILIIGASGGGHATLTMYMKSKHKLKYCSVWCPITDIEQWYYQTKYADLKYYRDIEQIVGSAENIQEMRNRSPMYMNFAENINRENTILDIFHGINDAYTGTVSVLHSLNFFNKIQDLRVKKITVGGGRSCICLEEIIGIVSRSIHDDSTEFIENKKLIYKKECGNIRCYIFDGTHEMLENWAFKKIATIVTQ